MDLKRFLRRRPSAPAVARFGEVPAVATGLGAWVRRSRRLRPARLFAEVQPFLVDAEHATAEDLTALSRRLAAAFAVTDPGRLVTVPVETRVQAWLAAEERYDELATFTAERTHTTGQFATMLVGGQIFADFDVLHPKGMPESLLVVEPPLSDLDLRIRRCAVSPQGVRLELFAVVRGLDYAVHHPTITVTCGDSPLAVEQVDDPAASRFSARRYQNHDAGAIHLALSDVDRDLLVTLRTGEFRRTAVLESGRIQARLPRPARPGQIDDVAVVDGRIRFEGTDLEVELETERRFRGTGPRPSGQVSLPQLEPSPELAGHLPMEVQTERHRIDVSAVDGQLRLQLAPPLTDNERGPWRQARLQKQHGQEPIANDLALFTAYAGRSVTDSPLAIQRELRRRYPSLRILWAVSDHSVAVPEGTEPVVVRSRAWYDAWSTSRLVVTNVEPDRWYRPVEGQLLVQTFHGYPSKTMGRVLWRSKNFSPRRIRYQLDHTSATWGLLVTPDEAMDQHYREQYDWSGPIVHEGYPRNDALVGRAADERRASAREELGIGDRIAVLHAPTWRDDKASNFRVAEAVDTLDIDAFARALPDHVLLMRGHRFHSSGRDRPGVIDVTDHPEINDLILAADVGVLDYSSMRFDFAVTGKPMVFLVPDLATYTRDSRGFLYPFEETTPGPLVADTTAVIDLVRDPVTLGKEYEAALQAFNQRFNRHHDGGAAARVVDAIESILSRPAYGGGLGSMT